MKCFAIVILLAAGVLSAPRFDFQSLEKYLLSKESDCGDLERLNSRATTIFDYVGETRNTIKGSTPDDTGLLIRARIYINPLKSCKFNMQVNEVELLTKSKTQKDFLSARESVKFSRELQAQELTFKVSNGKIIKLYPSRSESVHVLNIKRGILSTLQLGKPEITEEVDVNGRCRVKIVEKDGVIIKSKNISECTDRVLNEVGYQTTSFEKNDLPIKPLNSTSFCKYTMLNNRIRSVDCVERHIFRPFSAGYESPSGAITIVKQKLRYHGEKSGYISSHKENLGTDGGDGAVSLIYQHEKEEIKPDKSIVHRTTQIMNNLVNKRNFAAKQNSAHDFTKLVEILRKLNRKTMIPVWDTYFDCEKSRLCRVGDPIKEVYRQFLLDALTYCGTETCVYTVHNVIVDGEIARETMNSFLQGIALVAKPTKAMIRDVLNIAKKKPSRQSFLTLGTLMFRYCSSNPAGCTYDATNPITHAELFLERKLGKNCNGQENDERLEEILMALKAIGNAGRPIRAWQALLNCAQTSLHQNISVAALDALRRMPCNQEIQNALHKQHENINIDPETRIQVYLALLRCPSEKTLKRIVVQLEKEKSRQVGSFVASHLKNLNESSDPRHLNTQKVLSTILKRETLSNFNLDLTKYSRAFEGSVHSSLLKSGASVESHVIFSPDSYIPRSALLNMTATILDVPVNVLEMAARVEGLETLLEDFFGPDGYFPDNNVFKMFNITFTKEDIAKLRTRRDVDADTIDENIAELHKKINKKRVRPSGNLNVKVFGHEMRVMSYDDVFWAVDQIDNMNVIELLLNFAKGGHKTFTKSMLFLEMTHTVPTGLGLPLKLKLTGSTVASLELDGKVDIRNMFWGPSSMEIKGYVRPSAVVELSGQMGIHSHYVDSGIFVNSSMFTSQKLKGAVVYKEGHTLQVTIDAPEEPSQLFNFSSTPFLFLNEETNLVEGAPRRMTPDFCLNATTVLGLGLCTKLSIPVAFREYEAPFFPLSGPSSFGMNLIRSDPKLTTYKFSVILKKINQLNKNELVGWFEMGTPGATYSRHLGGIVKYVESRTSRTLTIGSFEGGMVNDELIKNKVEFMVSYHNDTNRFEMDLRSNLYTKKTIKMKFLYFNDTHFFGRQMGVLMAAEYDWYKFEHQVKFVKKATSYLFQTRTTYWPKKHITSEIEFIPATKSIAVKFNADQINQSVDMLGKYIKTKTEKGLRFTANHLSTRSKASFYVGILNEKSAKKFIINGTASGKKAEFIWGYYSKGIVNKLRFDANVDGKTMSLFADYNKITASWLSATVGGTVGKNKIGISTEYVRKGSSFDRKLCSFIFYNDKEPVKTCLALKKVPASWLTAEYKRLIWSTTVFSKSGAIAFDYKNNNGKYGLTSTVTYGDKMIFTNNVELMYSSIWNTALKMSMEVGKKTVSTKFFSTMINKDICTFGIEANGFNKMVKLMATYSKETKQDTAIHGVMLEAWVNKKLPVNVSVIFELGKSYKGISSIFKINSYMVKNSLLWIQPEANKYSVVSDMLITKGNFVIFRNKLTDIFVWSNAQKAYKLMWEFIIWNKKFEYGTDVIYQNHSTASKAVHILTFGVNYARNRRSSITTTLANSDSVIKLLIDVEYLPHRHVSHFIRFHKEARQLDVTIEFLPKMFVKFMARLDKTDGWRLTSDVTFDWVNYKKYYQTMTAYVNRADTKGLSFQFSGFGNNFYTGLEVNHRTNTGVFTITAFKRSLKLVGYWLSNRGVGGVRIFTEKRGNTLVQTELIEALVTYSKNNDDISLELKTPSRSLLKTMYNYDKYYKLASLEFFALERSLLKLSGQYKKYEKTIVLETFIVGEKKFQISGKYNKEEQSVILNLDANMLFTAKWDVEKKQVRFSTEILNRIVGFVVRLDPKKYVSSFHVFYQKNFVGWTAYLDKKNKAMVYNITLTPRLSGQFALEIVKDHIIKLTLQRKIGINVINETTLRYELTSGSSKFALQWNLQTLKSLQRIIDMIQNKIDSLIELGIKDAIALAKDVKTLAKTLAKNVKSLAKNVNALAKNVNALAKNVNSNAMKLSKEYIRDITAKVMAIIKKGEEHFDKFDFIANRDKIGEIVVSAIKKSAELSTVGLQTTTKMLRKARENLPATMKQTHKLLSDALEHTRKISTNAMEQSRKIATATMEQYREISREALIIAKIIYKVAKNLTESGMPVVKIAIKLAKEFRIRGKTMEQVTKQVMDMVENLSKTWKKNMEVQLKELKEKMEVQLKELKVNMAIQLKEFKKITKEYIRKIPIPYRSEKVGEMYDKIVADLLLRTDNFNWEKTGKKIMKMVLEYEIEGLPLEEHITTLKGKAMEYQEILEKTAMELPEMIQKRAVKLPEIVRKTALELIGKMRVHIKKTQETLKNTQKVLKKYINEIQHFSLPLVRLMKKIDSSICRHFAPLLRKAARELKSFSNAKFSTIYKPLRLKIANLVKEIQKFIEPMLRPIRPLYEDMKNQVRAIRLLDQEIGLVFDKFLDDFKIKGEVKLEEFKHSLKTIIKRADVVITSLITMTPEQMTETAVENTIMFSKNAMFYMKDLYKSRMEIIEKLKVQLNKAIEIVKEVYGVVTSKSVKDLANVAFIKTRESMVKTFKEAILAIDQIAKIEVIRPVESFWNELNLNDRFRKLGLNEMIMNAIKTSKTVNLTEIMYRTMQNLQKVAVDAYSKTEKQMKEMSGKTLEVYSYIRAIPKKDFEQLFAQVESFLKNKLEMKSIVVNTYLVSYARLEKMSKILEKMAVEYYNTYSGPFKSWYFDIKKAALMVYYDNKDDTMKVCNYYKAIIGGLVMEKYNYYKAMTVQLVKENYQKILTEIENKYDEINKKINALYNKYADQTWEEIRTNLANYGEELRRKLANYGQINREIVKFANEKLERVQVLTKKLIKITNEFYKKSTILTKEAIAYINNVIETVVRPLLTDMYAKSFTLIKTNTELYYKKMSVVLFFYKDLVDSSCVEYKQMVDTWYQNNKEKSLKTLYLEFKAILIDLYKNKMDLYQNKMGQYKIVMDEYKNQYRNKMGDAKEMLEKRYSEAFTKFIEMKKKFLSIKNKVLPILKEEAESMLNQTLRAAVILTNETAKAYYPHYTIAKNFAITYFNKGKESTLEIYTISRKKAITMYATALEEMALQSKNLIDLLKELLEKVKDHPAYEKIINHELIGKATQWLQEVSAKLENQINEARDKLKELQYHPKVVELKRKLEEKLNEYKKEYLPKIIALKEKLEEKLNEYKSEYHPKIIALKKKLEDKINEYKELLNEYKEHPNVEELINILKQSKVSGLHTVLKLKEKLRPHVSKVQESLLEIPQLAMGKINFFRQYPEEYFWSTVKNLTTILETLKSYDWTILHKKVWIEAKNLVNEITDEKTKAAAISALELSKTAVMNAIELSKNSYQKILVLSENYYKKLRMLPSWLKTQCKTYCTKNWILLKANWKRCPLNPIVNHEIWGEFAEEFLNHEIISELKSIALKGKKAAEDYVQLIRFDFDLKNTNLKERSRMFMKQLESTFNALVAKLNSVAEKTRLEDLVSDLQRLGTNIKSEMRKMKVNMEQELRKSYNVAKEKFLTYSTKVKAIAEKYKEDAKIMWSKSYSKLIELVEKATLKLQQTMRKAKELKVEYTKLAKEMKEKYSKKVMELWNNSELIQKLETFKMMTIRRAIREIMELPVKAIGEIKEFPEKAKRMTKEMYRKAVAEFKSYYVRYVIPFVHNAKTNVVVVFNEINETTVFVYRYYRMKDSFYKVKEYLRDNFDNATDFVSDNFYKAKDYLTVIKIRTENEFNRIAPKLPNAVKEYLKKVGKEGMKAVQSSIIYVENVDIAPYVIKVKAILKSYVAKAKMYIADYKKNIADFQKNIPEFKNKNIAIYKKNIADLKKNIAVFQQYISDLKQYIPDFKNLVVLDTKKGELVFNFPHFTSVGPSFTYHIDNVANQLEFYNHKFRTVSLRVMNQIITTTKMMFEKLQEKTRDLGKDFDTIILVNKKVGLYLLNKAKMLGNDAYSITLEMYKGGYTITMEISNRILKRVTIETKKIYAKTEAAIVDISRSNSIREAFDKTKYHYKIVINNAKALVLPYYRATELFAKEWYKDMDLQYNELLNKIKPYYIIARTAIRDWRSGANLSFDVIELQLEKTYRQVKADFEIKMEQLNRIIKDSIDKDAWKLADEYIQTNKAILAKYRNKIVRFVRFTKARLDRAIRIAKRIVAKKWSRPIEVMNPYRSVAMIFGKSHIVTFGNKYYDVPTYIKPHCTYLLARDFQRGNFTILSQKEQLIVITPDMKVKINMNGKVVTVINKKTIEDLPVQSDSGFCKRYGSFIECQFKQGLKIRCDKEHFLCTIELSGWHYSKSEGLLGTNNQESYDEMKLPDGTITESMNKFVNAWEVSGDRNCQISDSRNPGPACNKAPSEQCFKLLKEKSSPYSALFGVVDPVPFLKACQIDSTDCETKEAYESSHCNATAAYVHMLRLKGLWVPLPEDCVTYTTEAKKTYKFGESWVQPSTKSVDVVVMISERSRARSVGKQIANLIFNLDKKLNGYTTRFALVGFGGNGVHEGPHHHTSNGEMFSDAFTVATTIKKMPYTGNSQNQNDAYAAILLARKLQFRPSAARVFLLFNSDEYKPCAWYGPTLDETIMSVEYESNATVVAFDKFNFKSIGKSKVIGLNEKRVYLFPNQVIPLSTVELPRSPFTKLVKETHGGMFTNKLKPSQGKIIEMALTDTIFHVLNTNNQQCKSCVVRGCRYAGRAIAMCRNDNMVQC